MCGIAGLVFDGNERRRSGGATSVAYAMAATLRHRGPDDAGVWESDDGRLALAHRRLSIIDLSPLGRNPMGWDNRLWITFNGEIYNFRELRQELEADGYQFRSQTDTEIVLAAYDRWGIESVHRFVGMFAFGLWDEPRRRLWLVRDRLGKKPLYYAEYAGSLRFASELKALVSDADFPRTIDAAALRLYLRYGYIPAPVTIFAKARKLEPGHHLVHENGRVSVVRYWDPLEHVRVAGPQASEADAEVELEALLSTSIRQRQIADVPLGAFLSGGVDSSLIVALMQEQNTSRVRTFTIRFANPEFNEADYAAAVAQHLGTDHHEQTCNDGTMLDVVDRLPEMFDEPFGDSSAIPTYLVSNIARQHVTVALSGDGGDELFFGYPRYRHHSNTGWILDRLPRSLAHAAGNAARHLPTRRTRRMADVLINTDRDSYARFVTWLTNGDIARLTGAPAEDAPLYRDMSERTRHLPSDMRSGLLDIVSYLPDDILTKVDRASMAVGLEVRAPFLDHRVVEFALRLPIGLKRRGTTVKYLLRKLLYKRVPRRLIDRPKMGFGVPLLDWFNGPLRERMDDCCGGHDFEELGLEPELIRILWRRFKAGHPCRPDLLWQVFVLGAWARRHVGSGIAA